MPTAMNPPCNRCRYQHGNAAEPERANDGHSQVPVGEAFPGRRRQGYRQAELRRRGMYAYDRCRRDVGASAGQSRSVRL